MESRLLLDVVVAERAAVLELLAREDQALLVGRDAEGPAVWSAQVRWRKEYNVPLLVLDLGLDIVDGVRGLHLKGDSLAREGLYENLHFCSHAQLAHQRRTEIITTHFWPPLSVQHELSGGVVDEKRSPG